MVGWQVDVHIFDALQTPFSEEWLRGVVALTLASERLPGAAAPASQGTFPPEEHRVALSLVIADDETVHALNREYHGVDEVTDVLSFPFLYPGEAEEEDAPFVVPTGVEGVPLTIGEVIISYAQAVRQAQAAGHSVQREVALLTAHGVLHLLGYDHATPEEEAVMWRKQDAILATLFPEDSP